MPLADTSFAESPTWLSSATPLILVEEITHRVVNEYTQAIACIRLAAARAASHEARTALAGAANRLLRFAEAHRALQAPPAVGTTDLGAYLERLCAAISTASLGDSRITLTLSTISLPLRPDRCWRVALIVSELITNSVRHGLQNRPGSVVVQLDLAAGVVVCRVSDNGAAEADPPPARGRHVVEALAAELGGAVQWTFGSRGTTAELAFPREQAA
jgi:two-component sensor histidine kinase